MEKLLPYYERELALLRRSLRELAQRFPALAGKLGLSGDQWADPGIERLTQGTALLAARLSRKLEYGYERFTRDLLALHAPFYLRPIPSCSVVQVEGTPSRMATTIPRGTELRTKGTPTCKFRTAYDVTLAPVSAAIHFNPGADVPASLRLPDGIGGAIAITIGTTDPAIALDECSNKPLRVFIDAVGPARAALFDAAFTRTLCTCVQVEEQWSKLPSLPLAPVGYSQDEALLPTPHNQEESLRLLVEYFAFPAKFDFFDIDLEQVLVNCPAGTRRVTLHLLLPDLHRTATPQLLRSLPANALRLHCTPVVNMFSQAATSIRLRKRRTSYPVVLPGTSGTHATVYSVDAMKLLHHTDGGAAVDMQWFHNRMLGGEHCWVYELANTAYGTEDTVSFVDRNHQPLELEKGTVDVWATCTNGVLPCSLPIGRPGGDLVGDENLGGRAIRMLCQPSAPLSLADEPTGQWDAICVSHIGHRDRTQFHLPSLRFLLRFHARPESAVAARLIGGIDAVTRNEVQRWVRFKRGSALVYGYEITLTVDEAAFADCGIAVFAKVMERVLSYYLTTPHFLILNVLGKDGRELIQGGQCPGSRSPI